MVLWFFFLCQQCAAQSTLKMDQLPTKRVCRCLHFHLLAHLSIHLFSRVQRAAFSSEGRLKEQKKERKGGAGCPGPSRALSLWHESLVWSGEHNNNRPPLHPWARRQNNTHNAACLWLPESPVAILVPETWCQAAAKAILSVPNPWHTHCSCSVVQLVVSDAEGRICATDVNRAPRRCQMYSIHWPSSPLSQTCLSQKQRHGFQPTVV